MGYRYSTDFGITRNDEGKGTREQNGGRGFRGKRTLEDDTQYMFKMSETVTCIPLSALLFEVANAMFLEPKKIKNPSLSPTGAMPAL